MIQTHGHEISKSSFSGLCLIVGVGFLSRVLVVLQETNNVSFKMQLFVKCCIYEMPFLRGAIYVGCHFCKVVFLIRGVPFL